MKAFIDKINLFNCKTLPRKVFTFYFTALVLGTMLLILPISRNANMPSISLIDALFTVSSAFSNTGLTLYNTGTYFSIFGQIVLLILIQLGGLGLMTFKVLIIMFLGKKVGLKERMSITNERGNGKLGGTVDLIKTAIACIFAIELIAALLFSVHYYIFYFNEPIFNQNIFTVIYHGIFPIE